MSHRLLLVCTALLLIFTNAADAGRYQRTKDRKIRVWNEHPEHWDEAIWTGERDENGNATGPGVLTWYGIPHTAQMGSLIPSTRGHELTLVASFSGQMTEGRFEGLVVSTDAAGRNFHAKFVDGSPVSPWSAGTGSKETSAEPAQKKRIAAAAPEGPPPPAESPGKIVHRSAVVEAPTQDSQTLEVFRPPSSLRASYVAASPESSPPVDPAGKDPALSEFKQQTQSVFSKVGNATNGFREIERLDSVQPLPAPVSDSVRSLANQARDLRSKSGENAALQIETETADALSLVSETSRELAAKNPSAANLKLTQFLKNHPAPPADPQKPLWHYLAATQSLCDRQQKEADVHLQRAQSLLDAGHTNEAITEYKEANRLFPTQLIAEKIRQLSSPPDVPPQP